jgi:hypothetical protein
MRQRNTEQVRQRNHSLVHPPCRGSSKDVTMCNFNTIAKMEPGMFRAWIDILLRSPSTILWLLQPKGKMGEVVVSNLLKEAATLGISSSRIVMVRNFSSFCPILLILLTDLRHLFLFSISSTFGLIGTACREVSTFRSTPVL